MRLTRIDPLRNMARFYELHLQPTLFGETSLVRCWGRIGGEGRALVETHGSDEAAGEALSRWRRRKEKRGYAPAVGSIRSTDSHR
jgi:predicted DNA-binding WGR domain protein